MSCCKFLASAVPCDKKVQTLSVTRRGVLLHFVFLAIEKDEPKRLFHFIRDTSGFVGCAVFLLVFLLHNEGF